MTRMRDARRRHRAAAREGLEPFRAWARRTLRTRPRTELSPRLARVVHGAE